ncbi:MAG TPA: glycosyl transferase family 1 [Planktothrix sp. UBA10369]|nr:glycosyl transferase family 1 [Planktothrix sp. UBA10369]
MDTTNTPSPIIIIAGMHRSGTSLTASLLQNVGVNIGKKLVGADYGNIKGHFENIDFVDFHKSIFKSHNIDELGCVFSGEISLTEQQIETAKKLIEINQDPSSTWGWKDPRTTLFLDFWHQLLPQAKFIFVYRSPWEVIDSLYRRATDATLLDHPEIAIQMWSNYNRKILEFYHKYPHNCLLSNVYTVGNQTADFIQEINHKFKLNLEGEFSDQFEPYLLVNRIMATPKPLFIKAYFPEAIELYQTLEATAYPLNSRLTASELDSLNQPLSADWMFDDWAKLRKLEKNQAILAKDLDILLKDRDILETDIQQWQERFQDAVERLIKTENLLGETQLKLNGVESKIQEAITKLISTEEELGRTQGELAGFKTQFQQAVDKLVTTEKEFGKTQGQLQAVDAKYQEILRRCLQSETELGITQFQFQDLSIQYQDGLTKLLTLEEELGITQLKLLGSESQFQQALNKIFSLEDELGKAQQEIIAMKSSKFWKLREKWQSVKRRLKQFRRHQFIYSLDFPLNWELTGFTDKFLNISGWCFYTGNQTLQGIRAKIGTDIFTGEYGIERQDVADIHSIYSQAKLSGFYLQIRVSQGNSLVELEAQDSNGKWKVFASYPLTVSTLRASFDVPMQWEQRQGQILFAGWCCHPNHRITQLKLIYGNQWVICAYGLRRVDVGQVFPNWVESSKSGFETLIDLPSGTWEISLEAHLETGEILIYNCPQTLQVSRYGLLEKTTAKAKQIPRYARAIQKRIGERKQRLGRLLPMPWEIPAIMRQMGLMYRQTTAPLGDILPPQGFELPQPIETYNAWLEANQWTERSLEYLKTRLTAYSSENLPKISVVMPVYNPPIQFLEKAIQSVINQVYSNWELCIADDCSSDDKIAKILTEYAAKDSRIKVLFRTENGNISAATNSAASQATGEFIAFLDNDDELTPDALGEMGLYLIQYPETDFLYSDDDKIDPEGKRFAPQFKPDWSPQLLLSYMYMGHLLVVRRTIFEKLGGFRLGFEGSQDYDFALRATEISRQIGHLPLVLYHWRTAPGSTSISGAAKPASFDAGKHAIQEALTRRQSSGKVYQPNWASELNLGIFYHQFPDQGPSVTIIIPTKNQLKLLQACIESIHKTTYKNYQVVIVDNESDDSKTLEYFNKINSTEKISVLKIANQGKFNFAAINNRAVAQVNTDYVLFLNNDTEVINSHWLSQMVGYAQMLGVGAVGARLIYPDDRIQHAGILHGLHHGLAGHAFKLSHRQDFGYLAYSKVVRNYSAVTAACLLTPRQLFLDLGGFNQTDFAVAYNDVDYGYRLFEQGYQSVYCPEAELIHREGTSRGYKDDPKEVAKFRRQYANKIDPFYNPNLSLDNEWFQIQPRRYQLKSISNNAPIPKVLMCSNALEYTGAPLHQFEIAVKLASEGKIEPTIFCVNDGPLRYAYEQQGIRVIIREHPLANLYQRETYDTAIQALGKELQLEQFDLVYANTLENFFMVDCAKQKAIPCVWNVHESEPWQTYFDGLGSEIAARALDCFQFPYRVIFVADATRNLYHSLNSHHNFTVIHNGLDIQRLLKTSEQLTRIEARTALQIAEDEIVILLLGTVCERKGQRDLIKALPLLSTQYYHKIRCFIVGDRPSMYSTELAQLIAQFPDYLKQRLTLVSETPETAQYFLAADIFVCTSRIESYPRVIMEAMGYNLPIITTPVFGIPEQIRPEINGLFYTPEQPEELAKCITLLLENPDLRQEFAENAKYVLESLNTFEEMTQSYLEIFQEAYFINPYPVSEISSHPQIIEPLDVNINPPVISEAEINIPEPQIAEPQAKNYWETNPTAAASQWVSNPIIADTIHQRMSGGQTKKYWLRWLIEDYFVGQNFNNLISLGCGIGNHEILMAQLGFAQKIDAFDFSASSLEIARKDATEAGVQVNFYQEDFNTFNLNPDVKYDLAFCSGSLHHVRELERFLEIVHKALNPQGYFIINEYVGANYCIYNKRQVEIINRLYQCSHKLIRSGIMENKFINPSIHQVFATDPSEAVRSELILPFIEYYFDIELFNPFGGAILHPLYPLLDHNQFLPGDPKGETLIKLLLEFEQILMEIPGGLESDFCLCVLRPKRF